jgi:hypothetical protein
LNFLAIPRVYQFLRRLSDKLLASAVIVFGAWDAYRQPDNTQAEVWRQARASGHPVIVLDLHLPFDTGYLGAGTYLATFGDTDEQMEAVVEAVFGEARP